MALDDFRIFTRIYKTGSFKRISSVTRNALVRRLSPSINETEHHAVSCLTFIKHPDTERSSLWCAYGSKLKVYDTITWICDPNDLCFPSLITCMCLDERYKLWVGCIDGQLFVVDTMRRIREAQLTSMNREKKYQTIAYDTIHNHMLTANQNGSVTVWNASNWQCLDNINLYQIYRTTQNLQQTVIRNTTEQSIVGKNQNKKPIGKEPTEQPDISSKKIIK
jgi:hypothetical protein